MKRQNLWFCIPAVWNFSSKIPLFLDGRPMRRERTSRWAQTFPSGTLNLLKCGFTGGYPWSVCISSSRRLTQRWRHSWRSSTPSQMLWQRKAESGIQQRTSRPACFHWAHLRMRLLQQVWSHLLPTKTTRLLGPQRRKYASWKNSSSQLTRGNLHPPGTLPTRNQHASAPWTLLNLRQLLLNASFRTRKVVLLLLLLPSSSPPRMNAPTQTAAPLPEHPALHRRALSIRQSSPSVTSTAQTQVRQGSCRWALLIVLAWINRCFSSFKDESGLSVLSLESGETHPAHPTSSDKVSVRDGRAGKNQRLPWTQGHNLFSFFAGERARQDRVTARRRVTEAWSLASWHFWGTQFEVGGFVSLQRVHPVDVQQNERQTFSLLKWFDIQALYDTAWGCVCWHAVQCVSKRPECNIMECLHLYWNNLIMEAG